MVGIRRAMTRLDAAMGRIGTIAEGGEIRGGIGCGQSHCRCKKGELNKQVNPFILRKVYILG